jgi:autotransporter passenger strand-loop-strand repeat protein
MSWGWGNWSNWNNFDNFNNFVYSNPGYVNFSLQEPSSSNGGTISATENTPVDLSTAVGIASGQSYTEYYYQQQYGYAGYYYTNYGNPPSVCNFQFTAVNSPSPYNDLFYVNLANSNEFYISGNSVYLTANNQLFATLYSTPGELNVVIDGAYYQDYSQIADLIHSVYYENTSSHPPCLPASKLYGRQQRQYQRGFHDYGRRCPERSRHFVARQHHWGARQPNHRSCPGGGVRHRRFGVGTTSSGGTFDIITSALSDGSHSLTATATDPAQVTGAASAVFSVTVDSDSGEQNALGVTVNGGNPIAGAIATAVPYSVAGIESDDNGTVTFSDGVNPSVVVTITNGQVAPTANLSGLNDGPITVTLHLNNDAAGNSFTDVITSITLYAVIVSSGALTVSGGQTSGNILVLSGATLDVLSGGTAIDPVVSSGGSLVVASGGFADPTIIYNGASETISAGGTDNGALICGTQLDYGFASGVTIFTGSQVVEGGGTASGTSIHAGGTEIVNTGGTDFGAQIMVASRRIMASRPALQSSLAHRSSSPGAPPPTPSSRAAVRSQSLSTASPI